MFPIKYYQQTQENRWVHFSPLSYSEINENRFLQATLREIKKPTQLQVTAANKKSQKNTVVPNTVKNVIPIEQFKTFSVYEDSQTIISNEKKLDEIINQR